MKQNSTLIVGIIDRSGSMGSLVNDTIGGFNTFIKDQKDLQAQLNDEVTVTLVQFDDYYELNYNMKPIAEVELLTNKTYVPRGSTALLDAIGKTINDVGTALSNLPEEERPSKVLFLILTDGEDNRSKEFTKELVSQLVTQQREIYNWEFVFMGANIDAISVGSSFGFTNNVGYAASSVGTRGVYASMSNMTKSYRSSGSVNT